MELEKVVIYAKDQPQYRLLPAIRTDDGVVTCKWKLSDLERQALLGGADITMTTYTYGHPLQPVLLEVGESPDDMSKLAANIGA